MLIRSTRSTPSLFNLFLIITFTCILPHSLFSIVSTSDNPTTLSQDGGGPLFKKFEYIYSFKGPYLAQPDGSIPFWERRGNALPHDASVRVTPSLRNQRGALWTKNHTTFPSWEVELVFRISGRGKTGGDGMAFWYVSEKPDDAQHGSSSSVFGGFDGPWKGLGIFWDSYDNDANFNNPAIIAMNNNGSVIYDHDRDGLGQFFTSCQKDFRNKMFYTRARIMYHNKTLSFHMTNGMTKEPTDPEYEPCFYTFDLNLPSSGYFGISAATGGGVADDHDIAKFLTFSITTPPSLEEGQGYHNPKDDEEELEYQKKFQEYQDQLDKQKEEYLLEHPDAKDKHHDHEEEDEETEDEYVIEMRTIFKEQALSKVDLFTVTKSLDDLLGKHETISAAVIQYHNTVIQTGKSVPSQTGETATAIVNNNVMQRFEADNLLQSNKELLRLTGEIRLLVEEIDKQITSTHNDKQPAEFPGIPSSDPNVQIQQVQSEIEALQSGMRSMYAILIRNAELHLLNQPISEPSLIFCVSTKTYVFLNSIFTLSVLAFLVYKDKYKFRRATSTHSPSYDGPSNRFNY